METSSSIKMIRGLQTEKEFQEQVFEMAKLFGWRIFHQWISIRSPSGFVDAVMVRPPRICMIELKSERGRVTWAQNQWLDLLRECPGVETYLFRPSDWDAIVEKLR